MANRRPVLFRPKNDAVRNVRVGEDQQVLGDPRGTETASKRDCSGIPRISRWIEIVGDDGRVRLPPSDDHAILGVPDCQCGHRGRPCRCGELLQAKPSGTVPDVAPHGVGR